MRNVYCFLEALFSLSAAELGLESDTKDTDNSMVGPYLFRVSVALLFLDMISECHYREGGKMGLSLLPLLHLGAWGQNTEACLANDALREKEKKV